MKDYKHLFWDLDGTLINSFEGVSNGLSIIFDKYGVKMDKIEHRKFIGPPMRKSLRKVFVDETLTEKALAEFREYYFAKGAFEFEFYPNILQTLAKLKSMGYKLYVATSKRESLSSEVLKKFKADIYFDRIFGADDRIGRSEKEDVLNYAFDVLGIDKKDCVLIGDTMYDVNGAKEVGIDCFGVSYGFGDKTEMLNNGVVGMAESADEILKIFSK